MLEFVFEAKRLLFTPEGIQEMVRIGGLPVLVAIVFAETGLLVGFFLPGDSLLFIAGFMTGMGVLGVDFTTLNVSLMTAAIAGDTVGYWFGNRVGHALYNRPDSLFFKKKHLIRTHEFYERHGGKTIVLARFVPIVRTFAPIVAGIGEMEYRRFLSFNVWGGIGWVFLMTALGHRFGRMAWVQQNLEKAVLIVIFISILPILVEAWREHRRSAAGE